MTTEERTCEWCGDAFTGRSDARFCSRNHKRAASRARKRQRERVTSLGGDDALSQSSASHEAARAADRRFHEALADDQASRTPDAVEAEWRRWERRHPGTAHPGRVAARIEQGRRAADADWVQGTQRFRHEPMTLAEQARRSRGQQRRPMAYVPESGHDDAALEAEMIDAGNWRSGRKW